jgi:hypothetical protein
MSKEKHIKYSRHHLLPRHPYGNDSDNNIEIIKDNYHRAIHTLFANQLIAEQLITTVNISSKALREDVKQWLLETLNSRDISNPEERYDDRVIR